MRKKFNPISIIKHYLRCSHYTFHSIGFHSDSCALKIQKTQAYVSSVVPDFKLGGFCAFKSLEDAWKIEFWYITT